MDFCETEDPEMRAAPHCFERDLRPCPIAYSAVNEHPPSGGVGVEHPDHEEQRDGQIRTKGA
jgi:hypothetical protein